MAVPSFNGATIFGAAPKFIEQGVPAGLQMNAYPMVFGREVLVLGGRGRAFLVRGWLQGADVAALNSVVNAWRVLRESGTVAALVTTNGETCAYAIVTEFSTGESMVDVADGVCCRQYQARIDCLV